MTNYSEVVWYFVKSACTANACALDSLLRCMPFPLTLTSVICFPPIWPRLSICFENAIFKTGWWMKQKWKWIAEGGAEHVENFRGLFSIWTMFSEERVWTLVAYLLSCLFAISCFSHVHLAGSLKLKYRPEQYVYTAWFKAYKPLQTCVMLFYMRHYEEALHVQERSIVVWTVVSLFC